MRSAKSRAIATAALAAAAALSGCVTTSGFDRKELEDPQDAAQYNLQLGVSYLRQGRLDLARDKLERALKQDPQSAEVQAAAAWMYEQAGLYERAEGHYRTAVRLDPDDSAVLNSYGVFLCFRGRHEEAESHFLEAAQNPFYRTPEVAYTNAGVCARRASAPKEAEAYFRQALDANPRFVDALLQMADLSFQQENFLQARAFLQRYAESATQTAEALWLGVRTERAMGDAAAAETYARRLKKEYPESAQTRQLLESEPDAG